MKDNVDVKIDVRFRYKLLKEYTDWLKRNNIKYSLVKSPIWINSPTAINMRNEDAIIFRLTFGI